MSDRKQGRRRSVQTALGRFISLLVGAVTLSWVELRADTLIPQGAIWRWRPGTNEASAPVTAWRTVDFQDSQFTSAPAPFW